MRHPGGGGGAADDAPLMSLAVRLEVRWEQSVITDYWSDSRIGSPENIYF